jgi:hypothetical protein
MPHGQAGHAWQNSLHISPSPDHVVTGQKSTLAITIRNAGSTAWSPSSITISLNEPDNTLVAEPILSAEDIMPGVNYVYNIEWAVPLGKPKGTYHYDACLNSRLTSLTAAQAPTQSQSANSQVIKQISKPLQVA